MKKSLGTIAILGSGETSPNLVSVHRELLKDLDNSSNAYMIDSPFGFQENADELVKKIKDFYKVSLNIEINLATYRKIEELGTKSFFKSIKLLENSSFIFAGPGSPSYASKLWYGNEFEQILKNHLMKGSNSLFASAAASTLGEYTLPVYEIYKVGQDPYWEKGLNILEVYGLSCTVVPHFNNAEGGNHDTRYSYVGENRIKNLLNKTYTNILGIDEHTALIISGVNKSFKVVGIGNVTVINKKGTHVFKKDSEEDLSTLQKLLIPDSENTVEEIKTTETNLKIEEKTTLKEIADLEIQIESNKKNNERFESLVEKLIVLRSKLRSEKNYELSDEVRDILESSGLQIEDTEQGIQWKVTE
tara:strand:- start:119 stop:1198 length:1080 start_codon:yes stop_codon:yes gene_type:complete